MTLTRVSAAGSPRALGIGQGVGSAEAIGTTLDFYRSLGVDTEALGVTSAPYLDAARSVLPGLVEELEGLAEGAGISLEDASFLNCMEEVWNFEACTTMIHGHFFMHAEQWYAGHDQILVVTAEPDDSPAFVSVTCAGFLPAVGVSASGFAQGINSLQADDDTIGVPRVLLSRAPLSADGFEAALKVADTPNRAGGYSHVFATATRSAGIETSARFYGAIDDLVAHTNHYLLPDAPKGRRSKGSEARLERARRLLIEAPPEDLEDCARLLADHDSIPQSICLHEHGPGASGTVFALACDLRTGRMMVSDGPPCHGRWEYAEVPGFTAETEGARSDVV